MSAAAVSFVVSMRSKAEPRIATHLHFPTRAQAERAYGQLFNQYGRSVKSLRLLHVDLKSHAVTDLAWHQPDAVVL